MVDKSLLVDMSQQAYNMEPDINDSDWYADSIALNSDNGYNAVIYRNDITEEIVIAIAGTDIKQVQDIINDISIGADVIPSQYYSALNTYSMVLNEYNGYKVTITGHSLGGAVAQLLGATLGIDTVTFNAPGVAHLLPLIASDFNLSTDPKSYTNITNYNIANEWLNELNIGMGYQLLGNSYILPAIDKDIFSAHNDFESLKSEYTNAVPYEVWENENKDKCNQLRRDYEKGSLKATGIVSMLPGGILLAPYVRAKTRNRLRDTFTSAQSAEVPRDPLLIDLDGDGIETTSVENGVYFDQENDGFAEVSAWVSSDDGVLAIDKNNNGTIDNGSELFGDSYVKSDGTIATSGFDALSDLDSNGDGQINSSDTSFDAIKILKGDGTLLSLSDAGISSISLTSKKSVITDSNGNRQLTTGTYTKTDGSTGKISDYELQSDPMNSIATDWLEVSEEIVA